MLHKQSLTLKVANRKIFALPAFIFFILGMTAATLSPQPVLMTLLVLIVYGAGWGLYTLRFSKVNEVELNAVLFSDGRVCLRAGQEIESEGILDGQQWCSHHGAVLRYLSGGKHKHLVLLSAQQHADDYRRLKVWLRQDICTGTNNKGAGQLTRLPGVE